MHGQWWRNGRKGESHGYYKLLPKVECKEKGWELLFFIVDHKKMSPAPIKEAPGTKRRQAKICNVSDSGLEYLAATKENQKALKLLKGEY